MPKKKLIQRTIYKHGYGHETLGPVQEIRARVSQIDPGEHGPRFLLHILRGKYADGTTRVEQWEMRHADIHLWTTDGAVITGFVEQVPRALRAQPNEGLFRRERWFVPFSCIGSYS